MDSGMCNCPLGQCSCPVRVTVQVPIRRSEAQRARFDAELMLRGPSGAYIQHIQQQSGVQVAVGGGDARCDAWYVTLSAPSTHGHLLGQAQPMVQDLVNRVAWAYRDHLQRYFPRGLPMPQMQQAAYPAQQVQRPSCLVGAPERPRPAAPQRPHGYGRGKPAPAYMYMVLASLHADSAKVLCSP